jgi:hypothetical protein
VGPLFEKAFAKTTVSRDRRVYKEFRALSKQLGCQKQAAHAALNRWSRYSPTTSVGYVKSLKKLATHYGHIRLPRNWGFLALRSAKLTAASHKPRRAKVLTKANLKTLLLSKTISRRTRLLAALTFLSASRYDDLTRATTKCTVTSKAILRIRMPVDKGNPFGRVAYKYIYAKKLIDHFRLSKNERVNVQVPYKCFLQAIKSVTPAWTGHSGRRTATTVLSRKGYSLQEIQGLTLHSGIMSRALHSTRQYVDSSSKTPESRAQTRLSQALSRWVGW